MLYCLLRHHHEHGKDCKHKPRVPKNKLKYRFCLWSVSSKPKVHHNETLTHVVTARLFLETERNKRGEGWCFLGGGGYCDICDEVRQRKRCIFPQWDTLSPPWPSMFVTVIRVELFLMLESKTIPAACCLATCATMELSVGAVEGGVVTCQVILVGLLSNTLSPWLALSVEVDQ